METDNICALAAQPDNAGNTRYELANLIDPTDNSTRAQDMVQRGYRQIIPVIPPDADLGPESRISPDARGKAPGQRDSAGVWHGFNWTTMPEPDEARAAEWDRWGANVGCRMGEEVAALDIDVLDPRLAAKIADLLRDEGVTAPKRVG